MTHRAPRRAWALLASLLLIVVAASCTSGGSDSADSGAAAKPVSAAWKRAWAKPCTLLRSDVAAAASNLALDPTPTVNAQGRCRYEVAGQPTESVSIDLLGTSDDTSWGARTAGTAPFDANGRRVNLDVPGAGIVVRHGGGEALVRVASTSVPPQQLGTAVESLGKAVREKLPATGPGRLVPGERDVCGAVPPAAIGEKDAIAGDPAVSGDCAYVLPDATRIQVGLHTATPEDRTPGTKATCGGLKAQWFGNASGAGGSGHLVAVDGKVALTVTTSSPARSADTQRKLAETACAKLQSSR